MPLHWVAVCLDCRQFTHGHYISWEDWELGQVELYMYFEAFQKRPHEVVCHTGILTYDKKLVKFSQCIPSWNCMGKRGVWVELPEKKEGIEVPQWASFFFLLFWWFPRLYIKQLRMYGRPLCRTFCRSAAELWNKLANDIRLCDNPSLLNVN